MNVQLSNLDHIIIFNENHAGVGVLIFKPDYFIDVNLFFYWFGGGGHSECVSDERTHKCNMEMIEIKENRACVTSLDLGNSALLLLDLLLLLLRDDPALGGRGSRGGREVALGDVGRPPGDDHKGQAQDQCPGQHHVRN